MYGYIEVATTTNTFLFRKNTVFNHTLKRLILETFTGVVILETFTGVVVSTSIARYYSDTSEESLTVSGRRLREARLG